MEKRSSEQGNKTEEGKPTKKIVLNRSQNIRYQLAKGQETLDGFNVGGKKSSPRKDGTRPNGSNSYNYYSKNVIG